MLQSSQTLSSRSCFVLKQSHNTQARQVPVGRIYGSKPRIVLLARDEKRERSEQEESKIEDAAAEPKDFWEGEKWNVLGEISSLALPIFVVLAVLVGVFAAQTYNQDADVFLDSPRSDVDSAKLYKFE